MHQGYARSMPAPIQPGPDPAGGGQEEAPKLHLLFASDAPKAVILRRGPSKAVACILWDRATDSFQLGSWIYGQIQPHKSDLSPLGDYLIYQGADYRRQRGIMAFTAICKPPNLRPKQLWLHRTSWVGGGRFLNKNHFVCFLGPGKPAKAQLDPIDDLNDCSDRSESALQRFRKAAEERQERQLEFASQYCVKGFRLYRGSTPDESNLIQDFEDMSYHKNRAPFHDGTIKAKVDESLRGEW